MLSLATVRNAGYYAELSHHDDYYLKGQEPPGQWYGEGAKDFDLTGEIKAGDFLSLCAGLRPGTGEELVRHADTKRRRPGWDLTFSAPKTVSAIWATADEETRKIISECQEKAVKTALDYVQERLGLLRVGTSGRETEATKKLIFALYEHSTSRALDPQLHTHAVLINIGINEQGKTKTLESIEIHRAKMMLGALYRAELAHLLQERLAVEIERGEKNTFEVSGVPKPLTEHWSKRRAEIESALEEAKLQGAKAAAIATLNTRTTKDYPDRAELFADWREEAKTFGFDYRTVINRHKLEPMHERAALDTVGKIAEEITKQRAYFADRDLIRAVAERAPVFGLTASRCLRLAEKWLESEAVKLRDREQAIYTTKEVDQLEKKMLREVAEGGDYQPRPMPKIKLSPQLNDEQRAAIEYITQTPGQVKAVSGMAGTGKTTMLSEARRVWEAQGYEVKGVSLAAVAAKNLENEAGIKSQTIAKLLYDIAYKIEATGREEQRTNEPKHREEPKTPEQQERDRKQIMRQIYAEWKHATWQWDTETKKRYLGEWFKPTSKVRHEFLYATWQISKRHRDYLNSQLERGEQQRPKAEAREPQEPHPLNNRTVLVVDEAGMVGTRQMAALVSECKETGAKLVLVGDEKQLQPIEHGGPFKAIGELHGKAELKEIRRQREEWAREAVIKISQGIAAEALDSYGIRGLIHLKNTRKENIDELITLWQKDRSPDPLKLILAPTRAEVKELNERAQRERGEYGELGHASVKANGYQFHVGDRVVFKKNQKSLGLLNGETGTIRKVDPFKNEMVVKLDTGEMRAVPLNRYDKVELGYATTTHAAQGRTVDRAYVLAGGTMQDRELSYVQMSRAREETRIFARFDDMNSGQLAAMMRTSHQKDLAQRQRSEIQEQRERGFQRREARGNTEEVINSGLQRRELRDDMEAMRRELQELQQERGISI